MGAIQERPVGADVLRLYLEVEGGVRRPVAVMREVTIEEHGLLALSSWFGQASDLAMRGVRVRVGGDDEVVGQTGLYGEVQAVEAAATPVEETRLDWSQLLVEERRVAAVGRFGRIISIGDLVGIPRDWFLDDDELGLFQVVDVDGTLVLSRGCSDQDGAMNFFQLYKPISVACQLSSFGAVSTELLDVMLVGAGSREAGLVLNRSQEGFKQCAEAVVMRAAAEPDPGMYRFAGVAGDGFDVDTTAPGMCYVGLMADRDKWVFPWVTFRALLSLPRHVFLSPAEFSRLRVSRLAVGNWHVSDGRGAQDDGDPTAWQVFCALAQVGRGTWEPGSLGHSLSVSSEFGDLVNVHRLLLEVDLDSVVGGKFSIAEWLASVAKVPITVSDSDEHILTNSRSALSVVDKNRSRMLESVGDLVLDLMIAQRALREGLTVQAFQASRERLSSNHRLAEVFRAKVPGYLLHVPAGVLAGASKVGADAVEVYIGFVHETVGYDTACAFVDGLGVLEGFASSAVV